MAVGRGKSSDQSAKVALSLVPNHGNAAPWPLGLCTFRLDLRLLLLLLLGAVLMGGFNWGRACLHCAVRDAPQSNRVVAGEGQAGMDLAPHEVALPESSRSDSISDDLAASLAQLELQVSRGQVIPGWNTTGGSSSSGPIRLPGDDDKSNTKSEKGSSMSGTESSSTGIEGALLRVLTEQHKELRQQRLLIVESWRQIRSLRRHVKDLQSTKSSTAPRSLRGNVHSSAEGTSGSTAQNAAQDTVVQNRLNCTAGNGPYFYSPPSLQRNKPSLDSADANTDRKSVV